MQLNPTFLFYTFDSQPIKEAYAIEQNCYKWTVEDYHRLIETGILCARSVELLAGEIVTQSQFPTITKGAQ